MKTIDIYQQYYKAECEFSGILRHGASVIVTAESDSGYIQYTVSVNFFPHTDEDDFGITYDAIKTVTVYEGKGRRSRKREEELLSKLHETAEALADEMNGRIMWDQPLSEAVLG